MPFLINQKRISVYQACAGYQASIYIHMNCILTFQSWSEKVSCRPMMLNNHQFKWASTEEQVKGHFSYDSGKLSLTSSEMWWNIRYWFSGLRLTCMPSFPATPTPTSAICIMLTSLAPSPTARVIWCKLAFTSSTTAAWRVKGQSVKVRIHCTLKCLTLRTLFKTPSIRQFQH